MPSAPFPAHARHARQLLLPEVGLAGQERLRRARVLVVGAGGLGSPVAMYLAAAGVGQLTIVDPDDVEPSNLHRQLLHGTADVGRPKVESAADRLRLIDPDVAVTPVRARLDASNALALVGSHDLVVDGTDSFAARYLVNDVCVAAGVPNVYGSVSRFDGQVAVLATREGPCYRCLFPEPPAPGAVPSCAEGGVLGVLPGLVGTIQATEALEILLGAGEPLVGRLLLVDALRMRFTTVAVERDPACPACGDAARARRAAAVAAGEAPWRADDAVLAGAYGAACAPDEAHAGVGAPPRIQDAADGDELRHHDDAVGVDPTHGDVARERRGAPPRFQDAANGDELRHHASAEADDSTRDDAGQIVATGAAGGPPRFQDAVAGDGSRHPSVAGNGDITAGELAARLAAGDAPLLVDVREPAEWEVARLPGARLVPLATLPRAIATLEREREVVVYCHHGVRSDLAARWLRQQGFERVRNLAGGIDRWSLEVDPATPRY
jgi:molybdopterin/thiamine biosynthesis adenylyltransferase/rhodanese-related sulfurtransferase